MRVAPLLVVTAVLLPGCFNEPINPERMAEMTFAARLMWTHPYPNLLIEVDYVEGRQPLQSSLDHVLNLLHNLTDKRDIRMLPPTKLTGDPRFEDDDYNWSRGEINRVIKAVFSSGPANTDGANGYAFLHFVFLNGRSGAYSHDAAGEAIGQKIVIFPDSINKVFGLREPPELLGKKPTYEQVERYLLTHELGHTLGLVGYEIPEMTKRQSSDGYHHSTYRSSPMYQFSRQDLAPFAPVTGEDYTPDQFDEYDLQDLNAFRERGRRSAPQE